VLKKEDNMRIALSDVCPFKLSLMGEDNFAAREVCV